MISVGTLPAWDMQDQVLLDQLLWWRGLGTLSLHGSAQNKILC